MSSSFISFTSHPEPVAVNRKRILFLFVCSITSVDATFGSGTKLASNQESNMNGSPRNLPASESYPADCN